MLTFIKNSNTKEPLENEQKSKKPAKNRSTTSLRNKKSKKDKTGNKSKGQSTILHTKGQVAAEVKKEELKGDNDQANISKEYDVKTEDREYHNLDKDRDNIENRGYDSDGFDKSLTKNLEGGIERYEDLGPDVISKVDRFQKNNNHGQKDHKLDIHTQCRETDQETDNFRNTAGSKTKERLNELSPSVKDHNQLTPDIFPSSKKMHFRSRRDKMKTPSKKQGSADKQSYYSSDDENDQNDFNPVNPKKLQIKGKKDKKGLKVSKSVAKDSKRDIVDSKQKGKSPMPSKSKKSTINKRADPVDNFEQVKISASNEHGNIKKENITIKGRRSLPTNIVINLKKSKANKKIIYKVKSIDGLQETDDENLKKRPKMVEKTQWKKAQHKLEEEDRLELNKPTRIEVKDIIQDNGRLYTRKLFFTSQDALIKEERLELRKALEDDMSVTFKMLEEEIVDMSGKLNSVIDRHNEIWKVLHD